MLNSTKIISIGSFQLQAHHLLIIGILSLSFTISFLLRAQPADYGYELNEFDPFFNYRATQYIVENGLVEYYNWHDTMTWYPQGRDVSSNSQEMLHITAAITYWIFGANSSLYDFVILFPVIFGSLTSIVIFALVRVIGGTSAGLFASLLFTLSIPILIRGQLGWFKSEPLGLFFSLLGMYLFLSGIQSQNKKIIISKMIGAGIITTFGLSAWGGNQFFIIPLGIFFFALPFLRKDHKFLLWSIPLFSGTILLTSFAFERVSTSFVFGLGGISLILPTIFLVICILIQSKSHQHKLRNGLIFLLAVMLIGPGILLLDSSGDVLPLPSHRYLNAINPFLTTVDPLVDSVSEHATTTIGQSFYFHSVLLIFSGIGVWMILQNRKDKIPLLKNDMIAFALIIGMAGVYTSATFVRLEIFASVSVIVLSSLGLSILIKNIFNKQMNLTKGQNFIKLGLFAGIIILLVIPSVYPPGAEAHTVLNAPPTILNGGTSYIHTSTNDWLDALDWIKNNTPSDSVVASWWDYGYWISTMGERATIADNATLSTIIIQNIAKMLLSPPDKAWTALQEMEADYVVTFIAANQLNIDHPEQFYTLLGGGDESKKQWFMRIGGFDERKFLHNDGISGKDAFWNETLLGKMFAYTVIGYLNPNNIQQQSEKYVPGMIPIYNKDIKYPQDGDGPLRLVYASPSYYLDQSGPKLVVLVYEVNKNYVPAS